MVQNITPPPLVLGLQVTLTHDPDEYPELKHRYEYLAKRDFRVRYNFDSTRHSWHREEGYTVTDPDGEEWVLPERWVLLVEGIAP